MLAQVPNPIFGLTQPSGNVGGATAAYGQFLLPYPEFTQVNSFGKYRGISDYNGLIGELKRRFANGATVDANYTWTIFITNEDSQNGYLESGQGQTGFGLQDFTNPAADRSNSAADIGNRAVISYIQDLPFGKGKRYLSDLNGVSDRLVSGRSASGITTFQTGLPIGLTMNSPTVLQSEFGAGTARPNVIPGQNKQMQGSPKDRINEWFNTAAFSAADPYGFGNESRLDSSLRSQGIDHFDVNVTKTAQIHESINLQFRAEFFNIFNHPQFAPPNGALGNAAFGRVTAQANQPRIGQFSLRINY